jgi:acyl-coenzyme A thioesterase PaaI-like protein
MANDTRPDLSPEPGWEDVPFFKNPAGPRSFVSGEPEGNRLRTRYYRRVRDGALVGKVWFGPGTEGPPAHAHGGSTAAVLDEAMGGGAWLSGHPVLAAEIRVRFHRMLPLKTVATVEAWVDGVKGRKVQMRARLTGPKGELFSDSEGLFIELDAEQMSQIAQTMPDVARRLKELQSHEDG